MWAGAEEAVSKPGTTLGVGVGIGIGFYERHSKQGLIFFDPDTDPDPDTDVHCASSAMHEFGFKNSFDGLGSPDPHERFLPL